MEIKSKKLHEAPLNSEVSIRFPKSIPGFENQTHFQLFQQEKSSVIYLLQSVDDKETAFSVAHHSHFNINYNFVLTTEEESLLEVDSTDDLLILLILHLDKDAEENSQPVIKGSIKSPLIINMKKKLGIQKQLKEVEQSITLTETNSEIEVSEIG